MREISLDQAYVRMQLPKDGAVCRMFIDTNDVGKLSRLKPWNKVHTDEASRTSHNHASGRREEAFLLLIRQSLVRKKIRRGSKRMMVMMGHQKRGA
jgi:hypothetical protein